MEDVDDLVVEGLFVIDVVHVVVIIGEQTVVEQLRDIFFGKFLPFVTVDCTVRIIAVVDE